MKSHGVCRKRLGSLPRPAIADHDRTASKDFSRLPEGHGDDSLLAKMWVYSGLHLARYNIFDFRVSRHRDGPDDFFQNSRCKVQGDCFSGNRSVVLHSDERLEFVACWGHARRKVVEATTYQPECELLLGMIQALYDVETRQGDDLARSPALRLCRKGPRSFWTPSGNGWIASRWERCYRRATSPRPCGTQVRHWRALNVYVRDGRLPIDNNSVEQLMKQVAMGRKAWLFVCSVAGARQSREDDDLGEQRKTA